MFSKKSLLFGIFFAASLLSLSEVSFAQNTLQSGQSLQNQTNNTQNTGSLGATGSTNQNSNADVNAVRPQSLGVIGNPDQTNPSVSVGQTIGKTEGVKAKNDKSVGWILTIIIVFVLLIVFWLVLKFSKKVNSNDEPPKEEKPLKLEQLDPKLQSKLSAKSSQKVRKTSKKKSSKKAKNKK